MSEKYRLVYFPVRNRAEGLRWTLACSGLQWEDRRIATEEWAAMKSSIPAGMLPCLVTPEKQQLVQSAAIARFVGRRSGLLPSDEYQLYKVDEIVTLVQVDVYASYEEFTPLKSPEERRRGYESWNTKAAPKYLGYLETVLRDNQAAGGYLVGPALTIADTIVAALSDSVQQIPEIRSSLAGYQLLQRHTAMMQQHAGVRAYLKTRPEPFPGFNV